MIDPLVFDLKVTLLDTVFSERPLTVDEYRAVSLYVTRATIVDAVRHTLEVMNVASPIRAIERSKARRESPDLSPWNSNDVGRLLASQDEYFLKLGIKISSAQYWWIPFEGGAIEFVTEHIEDAIGSHESRKRLFVRFHGGSKWFTGVLATVLSGAILIGASGRFDPSRYYCTVGTYVQGDPHQLVAEAAEDLKMPPKATKEQQRQVWQARQGCLTSAGADAGPRDGKNGKRTRAGEKEFARQHGNVIVNWESPVFRRFVVQEAMKHHDDKGGESKADLQ